MDALPVIDLEPLRTGLHVEPTVAALDDACRRTGFFVVEGHGIAPAARAGIFAAAEQLFALPDDIKGELSIARSSCHRGYVGFGRETLGVGVPADLKEAFELSRDLGPDHPEVLAGTPLHGPNQWPDVPGFRDAVDAYYGPAVDAARLIARGLAQALGLDVGFFTDRMQQSFANLRLLHYPPQATHPPVPGQPGCGAHSDYGMITLLAEDDVGGLEVQHRSGEWLRVRTTPDQLVVNLGDMLARWTDDRWVSTMHRVTNPPFLDRYSIPLFVNPDFHVVVAPLDLDGEPSSSTRQPVTAGAFLLSRFDDTHEYRRDSGI
jgi:isopenicillin N synthase-like dioxygenase